MIMFGTIARGVKNAFRNVPRTLSVVFILAISVGLSLIMLLSYSSVQSKINSIRSSVGNTISLSPAGANGFEGGGEPLTNEEIASVKNIAHVTAVSSSVSDRLSAGTDTTLQSAIDPGTLGNRAGRFFQRSFQGNGGGQAHTFTIPISVTGISDSSQLSNITSGKAFDASTQDDAAVVGKDLASKNNLSIGSTFSAYNTNITVSGIFDSGTTFGNANFFIPIKTLQTLSQQQDQVTSATVTVDNIGDVNAVVSSIKDKIGADKVDVVTTQDQANQAIAPLQSIQSIALYSLIGALIAGTVITLLTMVMIVRERRKEIGVLKAIGASNNNVVMQFVSESFVLVTLGSIVGVAIGIVFSNPVLSILLKNAQASSNNPGQGFARAAGGFRAFTRIGGSLGGGINNSLSTIHASIGINVLIYGLLVAVLIAVIGSAIPAWFIARVKPAEVMRTE